MARGTIFNLSRAISQGIKNSTADDAYKRALEGQVVDALRYGLANVQFVRRSGARIIGHNYTGDLSNSVKSTFRSIRQLGKRAKGDGVTNYAIRMNTDMLPRGYVLDEGGRFSDAENLPNLLDWVVDKMGNRGASNPYLYWASFATNIIRSHRENGMKGTGWIDWGLNKSPNDFVEEEFIANDLEVTIDLEIGRFFSEYKQTMK